MENWKAVAYLLASGQGFVLSLALLLSPMRKGNQALIFLGLILFVLSLELLNAWGMQVEYQSSPDAFPFWLMQSYLVLPPSVWLLAQFHTNPDFTFEKKYIWLYVPAGIDIAVQVSQYLRFRLTGKGIQLLDIKPWFFFAEILPILGMVFVLWIYGRQLASFTRRNPSYFASLNLVHIVRLYGFFTFLVLLTVLWVAGVLLDLPIFFAVELILTIFLFTLGYVGYFDPAFFSLPQGLKKKTPEVLSFPNYDDQRQLERLKTMFVQHALHTRPKLSLEELAGELKLPPRYVSYLINTYHATNFHHFVNAYRVQEVIRKINDPTEQHKTLLALALESGFNSKSSFNQVFKSHTGQSPSEYLLSHK